MLVQQSLQQSASVLILRQQVNVSLQFIDAALRRELCQEVRHRSLLLLVGSMVSVPMSMTVSVTMAVVTAMCAMLTAAARTVLLMVVGVMVVAVMVRMTVMVVVVMTPAAAVLLVLLQMVASAACAGMAVEMRLHGVAIETVRMVLAMQARCTARCG